MQEPQLRKILAALGIQVVKRGASGWLEATCPFAPWLHGKGTDSRPSFGAKVEGSGISAYACKGCKMTGRISSLARALGHYRTGDLHHYRQLIEDADVADLQSSPPGWDEGGWFQAQDEPQEPVVEEIYANMFFPAWEEQRARTYLEGRGVGEVATASMGLKFDPMQERVLFPVRGPDGQFYGYTGRSIWPTAEVKVRDYAGLKKRQHMLGAERWRRNQVPLIVVEGLFAFAHLVQIGVEKVADVGALLGSEVSDWKRDLILAHGHSVYLLVDNDAAGDACLFGRMDREGSRDFESGAIHALHRDIPVMVPPWPEGKDDPDQLTKREVWHMLRDTPVWSASPVPPAPWVDGMVGP